MAKEHIRWVKAFLSNNPGVNKSAMLREFRKTFSQETYFHEVYDSLLEKKHLVEIPRAYFFRRFFKKEELTKSETDILTREFFERVGLVSGSHRSGKGFKKMALIDVNHAMVLKRIISKYMLPRFKVDSVANLDKPYLQRSLDTREYLFSKD